MKQLKERYIYDVIRRLPEKMRDEVKNELTANISDMLGNDESEEHISAVLMELGNPRLLANEYRGKERYLISPAYFDLYWTILRIVLIVIGALSLFGASMDAIITSQNVVWYEAIGQFIGSIFSGLFEGLTSAFAIVTLVFVIIDYKNVQPKNACEWKLSDLPELPKESDIKVSRSKI